MLKSIENVFSPPAPHMVGDGFRVHNFFPGYIGDLRRMSPFFMMDYASKVEFPPSNHQRGVGVHPHRGFETVTLAYHGKVAHHDSAGNHGIVTEGGVQWMTAASGVLHKEYHEKEYALKGGPFQMVQLWVNLPAKHKMDPPRYQALAATEMGKLTLQEGMGHIDVVAGSLNGVKGTASTHTPMHVYNMYLNTGADFEFSLPENYNTGLLVVEGNITIQENTTVELDHFALFKNNGTSIKIHANNKSTVLLLSGEPIQEPIVAYGPFLMNTKEEIIQAYDDVNNGKFGHLED